MTGGLTQREAECLTFIRAFIGAHDGASPNYTEIQNALRLRSRGTAHAIVQGLVHRGFVVAPRHRSRGISLTERGEQAAPFDLGAWLESLSDEDFKNAALAFEIVSFTRRRERALARVIEG